MDFLVRFFLGHFFFKTLPHFACCLKKIDTTSVSIQQTRSFCGGDLCIWAWCRKGSSSVSLRTPRFPGGPELGRLLVVSAPCEVSQQERAVEPGSCHHSQHLKVLWKTNSPFERFKCFPAGKYVCFLFFPVTFRWPWSLALLGFGLGNEFVTMGTVLVMPFLVVISELCWGCLEPPGAGAGSLALGWACAQAGNEECAGAESLPCSVAGLGSEWQP